MPSIRELTLHKDIDRAFGQNIELAKAIKSIIEQHPSTGITFQRIIDHFSTNEDHEKPRKRVKTEPIESRSGQLVADGFVELDGSKEAVLQPPSSVLTVRDLSFVTPLRKKLTLNITTTSVQVLQPGDGAKIESEISFNDMTLVALLPVPEKAAKLYNFCIFNDKSSDEVSVFSIPDSLAKNATGQAVQQKEPETYKALLIRVFNRYATNLSVAQPDSKDFISAIPQPHRRNEPAVHITTHRGSKEGYLFFLPNGLVYGFKRPIIYIPLASIVSVTYNDILQRTFNLTVTSSETNEEMEFSMIDIAEYDSVDAYVKKYKLNDASLSETRKAKGLKIGNDTTQSEISKAADEIAASVTGHAKADSDDDEDGNFEDDASHGGSTLGSSEADSADEDDEADSDDDGDEDIGSVDTDGEDDEDEGKSAVE